MIAWLPFADQLNIAEHCCRLVHCIKGKPIDLDLMEARKKHAATKCRIRNIANRKRRCDGLNKIPIKIRMPKAE